MGNWLAHNWGNLLSLLGVAIALWQSWTAYKNASLAKATAENAERKIRLTIRRANLVGCKIAIERGLACARRIGELRLNAAWPQSIRDELREILIEVGAQDHFTENEQLALTLIVAGLREPVKNTDDARIWIREQIDELLKLKVKLGQQLDQMESLQ